MTMNLTQFIPEGKEEVSNVAIGAGDFVSLVLREVLRPQVAAGVIKLHLGVLQFLCNKESKVLFWKLGL